MTIRQATEQDRHSLVQLWQTASYVHLHAEWQPPIDWLGNPTFVLWEEPTKRVLAWPRKAEMRLQACLAVVADPLPAAWVRIAAAASTTALVDTLNELFTATWPAIEAQGITELGWLVLEPAAPRWLPDLGFTPLVELITYVKLLRDEPTPPGNDQVQIRPVRVEEMEQLAVLDAAAYEPLWRYSAETLALARPQSLQFDVALLGEKIVGSLFSMAGDQRGSAHLVRLTVSPEVQGQGVGRSLMNHFLRQCRQQDIYHISLNTQMDNRPSQKLYHLYGFHTLPNRVAVWHKRVNTPDNATPHLSLAPELSLPL